MVTSRHSLSIESQLNQSLCLEICASDTDVRIYLEGQIANEGGLKRHIQQDHNLRNTILDTIVKRVKGMLVYQP
jgi:hypothetical protein